MTRATIQQILSADPVASGRWSGATVDALERLVADEREDCAKIADVLSSISVERRDDQMHFGNMPGALMHARKAQLADDIAAAIRGRGGDGA